MSHTRYARRDATRQSHPFHAFLRPEQLGIRAVRGHEIVMRALLDDDTPIKHYDMVRVGRVRHAVRDHQHGCAGVGERANRLQNQRFAVRVDAAGRLVENIDSRPAQQYTGDRNALFLPAGQIRAVLRDRHIESSRLRAHEIVDMRGFQRLPQLVVGGVGAGHEQVVAQGAGEQVAVRGDDGDSRVSDAAVRSRIWCDFRVSLSSGAALLNIAPSTSSCIPDGISDSSTSPSYPTSVPASSWTAVDLPEPDGPTIAVTSPGSARRATLRKA